MNIIRKFIGAKSKFEKDIPYTYEARIKIVEGNKEYNSYVADTICGLVEHLDQNGITPDNVAIFEIFSKQEKPLDIAYCVTDAGRWMTRSELCKSFKQHYPGHIDETGCTFEDREKDVSGP